MVIDSGLLEIERPQLSSLNVKKFTIGCSPTELFQEIQERYEYAYLLESMTGPKKLAQFSFIGFMPTSVISVKDGMLIFQQKESNEQIKIETQNPLNIVKQLIQQTSNQEKFRFDGGAVGYISYEAVRYWEKIPNIAISDQNFPDIHMGIYNDGIVFDHIQ
ncbi:MAG: hypothetical protein KAR20_27010 [Candidatus Heimdallarchaeota archaeon]|nr:hypothetical protein [Candidatus Heimdallarchaeota archaeon]